MADFGSSQDISGVFAGLAAEDLRRIQQATRQAATQARQDQAAIDADTYSKWKAGQISDEAWLAFLRDRADSSEGDPEEHAKWMEALREHTAAISDAQQEIRFQTGRITAQGLMSHYNSRMQAVETNSPAWRELAGRYHELAAFVSEGGTYVGTGGGRRGGGGGGGGGADGEVIPALGTEGPVDPTNILRAPEALDEYFDGLMSDLLRIDDLNRQHQANPDADFLVDMLTGEEFAVTPDILAQIDRQYLLTQDVIAAGKWGVGKVDDAARALAAKGRYLSETVTRHNTDRLAPVYDALEQSIEDRIIAASQSGDPFVRMAAYKSISRDLQAFEDGMLPGQEGLGLRAFLGARFSQFTEGIDKVPGPELQATPWTVELPPEIQPFAELYQRKNSWQGLMEAFTNENLSDEERRRLVDTAIMFIPRDNGFSRADIQRFAGVDGNDIVAPEQNGGVVGGLMNRLQRDGLLYGTDPNYDGPRFTHILGPGGSPQVADAELTAYGELVPFGIDREALVQVAMRIGGRITTVWAEPQPIADARFAGYRYESDQWSGPPGTQGRVRIASAGDWVPSSVIAKWGRGGLQSAIRAGEVVQDSVIQGVQLDNDRIWFYDAGTGLLSLRPPALTGTDPVTGGLLVGDDMKPGVNPKPFAGGVPIAFSGISASEMQAYAANRVANGSLILTGYKSRGAGGEIQDIPPDLDGLYYDRRLGWAPRIGRARGGLAGADDMANFDSNLLTRENSASRQWAIENLTPDMRREFRRGGRTGRGRGLVSDEIQEFATDIGVKIGKPTTGATREREGGIPDPIRNPLVARDNAFAAMRNRARLEKEVRFEPVKVTPARVTPVRAPLTTAPERPRRIARPIARPRPRLAPVSTFTRLREG